MLLKIVNTSAFSVYRSFFYFFRPFLPYGVTFCRTILTEVRQFGLNEILSLC